MPDQPIRETPRSEAVFYNSEIKAPIRIHKYNIDAASSDEDEEAEENSSDQVRGETNDFASSDEANVSSEEGEEASSVEKRDNIKDNLMDLERISLYSEKSKRGVEADSEPQSLDELLDLALQDGRDIYLEEEDDQDNENPDESSAVENDNEDEGSSFEDFSDFKILNSNEIDDYTVNDELDTDTDGEEESSEGGEDSSERTPRTVYIDRNEEPLELVYEHAADDDGSDGYDNANGRTIIDYIIPDYDTVEYPSKTKRSSQVVVEDPGVLADSSGKTFF
jgi:hypothetical protein